MNSDPFALFKENIRVKILKMRGIVKINKNLPWEEPEIKKLGKAKDLIKGLSPVFDNKTGLTPVDEFNAVQS